MADSGMSPRRLKLTALGRLVGGALFLGALLFLPAGTLRYWEAWIFLAILIIPASIFGTYLLRRNPALLERRMRTRERESAQKRIIAASTVVLLAVFLVPGFDRRFGLSSVPVWLVFAADGVVFLGYLLCARTFKENEYAARTVEVENRQRVVSTGPYGVVRHPMYLAVSMMFGVAPLALGSYWALIPAALLPLVLVVRILNEEEVLVRDLSGYAEYRAAVRYRLIPWIW